MTQFFIQKCHLLITNGHTIVYLFMSVSIIIFINLFLIYLSIMAIALFLGRFQPFHNGHLEIIRKIMKESAFLKIVIGSSQYSGTEENPFSAEERSDMIHAALEANGITQFETTFVPDINDHPGYVEHVEKLVGKFDRVYASENKLTKELFSDANYDVVVMKRIEGINSTDIRKLMQDDNNNWKELVPEAVVSILEELDCVKRVKESINK